MSQEERSQLGSEFEIVKSKLQTRYGYGIIIYEDWTRNIFVSNFVITPSKTKLRQVSVKCLLNTLTVNRHRTTIGM